MLVFLPSTNRRFIQSGSEVDKMITRTDPVIFITKKQRNKLLPEQKICKKRENIRKNCLSLQQEQKRRMNNDSTQQLSSQGNTGKDEHCGLLAAASDFARSVLESVQALAGTTTCKGVQIARLKDWAISNHCLIDRTTLGTFSDRGSV